MESRKGTVLERAPLGLDDYEPDIVFVAYVRENNPAIPDDGGMSVYPSCADARAHVSSLGERILYVLEKTVPEAMGVAAYNGFEWVGLLDGNGNELRRWVL